LLHGKRQSERERESTSEAELIVIASPDCYAIGKDTPNASPHYQFISSTVHKLSERASHLPAAEKMVGAEGAAATIRRERPRLGKKVRKFVLCSKCVQVFSMPVIAVGMH
jgi:hypothetical protein